MGAPFTTVSAATSLAEADARDAASFERVFRDHAPLVWRAMRRLGVRESDVEDACQEVFLVVHRRLASYDGRSALRTWVYGICIRVASDFRRKVQRKREDITDDPGDQPIPAEQDTEIDRRRALAWLDGVLDTLDEEKRAVFVLHDIEQVTIADVAAAAGCPLQTAYSRLYAARKHIEAAARREQARWSSR